MTWGNRYLLLQRNTENAVDGACQYQGSFKLKRSKQSEKVEVSVAQNKEDFVTHMVRRQAQLTYLTSVCKQMTEHGLGETAKSQAVHTISCGKS